MKVIITGGSRGIGFAIAKTFIDHNAEVFIISKNPDSLNSAIDKLKLSKNNGIAADLSILNNNKIAMNSALAKLNGCDVLINNAGFYLPGIITEEPDGILENLIQSNVYSAYYSTRNCIAAIKESKKPHIFNICSIASIAAYPNGGSYSISKFALLGLTKVLRAELLPFKIPVTAVLPGAVLTDSWAGVDLPESRFIQPENIAQSIYNAYEMNKTAVVEEIIIRPVEGDI